MSIPKTLGACADKLAKLRDQRYDLQHQVAELKKQETAIEEHLINELPKDDADGIVGRAYRATIVLKTKPRLADWDAFAEFVRRKKYFQLLQRRVNEKAVQELWDDKKVVPGIEKYGFKKVSLTKK